jgi:hypothetical protein
MAALGTFGASQAKDENLPGIVSFATIRVSGKLQKVKEI